MEQKNKRKEAILKDGSRILLSYLRPFRGPVLLAATLALFQAVADGTAPFLVGRLFDAILQTDEFFVIYGNEVASWVVYIVLLSFAWLSGGLLSWGVDRKRRSISTDLTAYYPAQAVARLLRLSVGFYKTEKMGEIMERMQRARSSINTIVGELAIGAGPEFLSVIIGLSIAFFISPILASILLLGVLVYLVVLVKLVSPITGLLKEGNKQWRESSGMAYDAISNYQAVKQATAEGYEERRIRDKFMNHAAKAWKKVEYIWSGIGFYQRIIVIVTQVTVIALSVYFIRTGELTIGELVALNGYAGMLFGPFVRLGHQWQTVQSGLINVVIAEDMYEQIPEKTHGSGGKRLRSVKGGIVFENVKFSYPDDPEGKVLKDLSFVAHPGETVALVGRSGVGKSTTIELFSGYYYPSAGRVLIDGNDTRELDLASLRRHIGVVPQEPVLFNDSIMTNIRYGKFGASDLKVIEAAKMAHAHEFIKDFPHKYKQLVGERGIKLSVGQKQRIAIARAILRNPKILILDEPTSALDARTEQLISGSLEKLMKGRTTFIIAHRLSTVRKADKILVFDKGEIVEEGKHDALIKIKGGVYRGLYEYQVGLHN